MPAQTDFKTLVLEYAGHGDLYSCLQRHRLRLPEARAVSLVIAPTLAALSHLHARGIIHRDVKPENLLLSSDNTIKLADFGLSVCIGEEAAVTRAGTLDYMAPEVIICPLKRLPTDFKDRPHLAYSPKADSWSIGVLAYELLTGRPPWRHRDEQKLLAEIHGGPVAPPVGVSAHAADWLRCALTADPLARASVDALLAHPWIVSHLASASVASSGAVAGTVTSPDNHAAKRHGRRAANAFDGVEKARVSAATTPSCHRAHFPA
jgi:serine/threonine protein kinase